MASRSSLRTALATLALVAAALRSAAAQDPLGRAVDLERQGRYAEAGAAFRSMLARDPVNVQGLLGVERVYTQLGRRDTIVAVVRRALLADSTHTIARTIELRTARATGGDAAAAEVIQRWMLAAPRSDVPWRELVRLLIAQGRYDEARATVDSARARLGDPRRLRPEAAQIEAAAGNWGRAAAEWRDVVVQQQEVASVAAFNLRPAPVGQRERVIRVLEGSDSAAAPRRVVADLLLAWDQPERAWQVLASVLPAGAEARSAVLGVFAERARSQGGPEAKRMAGAVYERLAADAPPADAVRHRIAAARAYAEGGDAAAARRVLRGMADDPRAPADVAVSTGIALVELYAREGNAAEAERLLAQSRPRLTGSEADRLAIVVARAWITAGDFPRAAATVQEDPSLAADDVRGWVALYRGRLKDARPLLRGAGLAGSDSGRAVRRAAIAALLQEVRADSLPALGQALFQAERGDTAGAVRALVALARTGASGGEAELLALAARWSAARDPAQSESLWSEVADRFPEAPSAPVAGLALARVAAGRGDLALAARRLEAMILRYPDSALVPEARRELDRVRGLVPRS
jgi:tetratricopeptide (TPR) repeat protein